MIVHTPAGPLEFNVAECDTIGEAADLIALDQGVASQGNGFTLKVNGVVQFRSAPTSPLGGVEVLELIEFVPAVELVDDPLDAVDQLAAFAAEAAAELTPIDTGI